MPLFTDAGRNNRLVHNRGRDSGGGRLSYGSVVVGGSVIDNHISGPPSHSVRWRALPTSPHQIRVVPAEMASAVINLSIANMDFIDFVESAGPDGVYRSFLQSWTSAPDRAVVRQRTTDSSLTVLTSPEKSSSPTR